MNAQEEGRLLAARLHACGLDFNKTSAEYTKLMAEGGAQRARLVGVDAACFISGFMSAVKLLKELS